MSSVVALGSNWRSQSTTVDAGFDDAGGVLREVADLDFVAPLHIAGVER